MGGTIFIHMFGAYFGLAASMVIGKPDTMGVADAEASEVSDVFSLIGTTFLWIFWPSFNGATAMRLAQHSENSQLYTTANTVLALCSSCSWTFIFSRMFNKGKINPVDIQNATLAGGVAIGASSDMMIRPVSAMICGIGAAFVSCFGFNVLQAKLEGKFKLHDSCGVHNLHGMPAIFGTVVVAIAAVWDSESYPHRSMQSAFQVFGALATLGVAIPSGLFTGFVMKKICPTQGPSFVDSAFWTVADHGKVD